MKKLLLASTLLTLLFVTNVYGKAQKYKRSRGTQDTEQMKFGIHLHSILFGHKLGGFVEYKIHEAIGLQTGLIYFNDAYLMRSLKENSNLSAIVTPGYISVPLVARFYPGEERQFCMFAGLQINYLTRGGIVYIDSNSKEKDIKEAVKSVISFSKKSNNDKKPEDKIKDTSTQRVKISNWGYHFLMGFDYEYLGGFQLGLEYGWGVSNLAECDDTFFNWTLRPSLGYNFAKLFN